MKQSPEMIKLAEQLFSAIPNINKPRAVTVVHAEGLSESDFRKKFLNKSESCLIKGAVQHWPAVQRWKDKNHWLNVCKNDEVKAFPNMNYFDLAKREKNGITIPFHEAITRFFEGDDNTFSIPSQPVETETLYEGLKQDITGFSFLPNPKKPLWDYQLGLFIYKRAATSWHVHYCDETLMCQVRGNKRVAIIPAKIPCQSYVTDFLERELFQHGQKMNESLDIHPYVVEVSEGDALYIPPHWFHCVVPADGQPGFTVTYNFRSPIEKYGDFSSYFVRKLYKMSWTGPSLKIKLMVISYGILAVLKYQIKKIAWN